MLVVWVDGLSNRWVKFWVFNTESLIVVVYFLEYWLKLGLDVLKWLKRMFCVWFVEFFWCLLLNSCVLWFVSWFLRWAFFETRSFRLLVVVFVLWLLLLVLSLIVYLLILWLNLLFLVCWLWCICLFYSSFSRIFSSRKFFFVRVGIVCFVFLLCFLLGFDEFLLMFFLGMWICSLCFCVWVFWLGCLIFCAVRRSRISTRIVFLVVCLCMLLFVLWIVWVWWIVMDWCILMCWVGELCVVCGVCVWILLMWCCDWWCVFVVLCVMWGCVWVCLWWWCVVLWVFECCVVCDVCVSEVCVVCVCVWVMLVVLLVRVFVRLFLFLGFYNLLYFRVF